MITDMHCHFVPERFLKLLLAEQAFGVRLLRQQGDAVTMQVGGKDVGLNTGFFDLGKHADRMQALGIERSVLSLATTFIDYALPAEMAVPAAQVFNDAMAETIAGQPGFRAWAFLPMQDPVAAASELRRCVKEHGCVGGHVASNVRGRHLYEECFTPVHQMAVDLNVPLFVHPADPAGKERMDEFELTIVAGYLFDNTLNLLKMVCSGFLDRWPALKLVFAHTGAFGLLLRRRMQREVDTNPVLSSTMQRSVAESMRQLYFDTVCFEPDILRFAASVVPAEHLLMGSDAPFPLGEPSPVTFVRNALPGPDAEQVLSCNFDRLLAAGP